MNQTKLKYARERLHAVYGRKKSALSDAGNKTKPSSTSLDDDEKHNQVINGIAKFSLARFKKVRSYYRDNLYQFMVFKEDKSGEKALAAWTKEQKKIYTKLRERYEFIEEELMLGDEETALKLIRDFAKE